ncbi:MAG: 2-hydroxycarboxylate transporter family protein [Rhodomicrobium sp.]
MADDARPLEVRGEAAAGFRIMHWWRLMETRIGIVPVPVFVLLLVLITAFTLTHKMPDEISVALALMVVGGFTCAEIGKRLPVIRNIGAAAIFATFIPSALVYYQALPADIVKVVTDFHKQTNFLYLFITCIIVGSVLSMNRTVLIKGFLKIFVPLAAGTVVAAIVGTAVGVAMGLEWKRVLFFVVVPIMAGGVGEGAIPLSIGYSEILGQDQGALFAQVLPPVMFGSLTAILLAGTLNWVGKVYPHLTGEGRLQPGEQDEDLRGGSDEHSEGKGGRTGFIDTTHVAAAGITAVSLYLIGVLCHHLFGLPGPVAMLFAAVMVKIGQMVSPQIEDGARVVYNFFRIAVTYPLLFMVGVAITPWKGLVEAFHPANIATIIATVVSLMVTGFFVGKLMGMYPIETAIVNSTHSGQGGTGDIAILTAANRMVLLPFAQVATRIGGAIVVTIALIVLSQLK